MGRSLGLYPGGPKELEALARSTVLANASIASVAELESQRFRGPQEAQARRRRTRLIVGAILAVTLAVATGYWLGTSHRMSEQDAVNAGAGAGSEDRIDEERDRILRELWKMEAVERASRSR